MEYYVQLTNGFEVFEFKVKARTRSILIDKLEDLMHEHGCNSAEVWYDGNGRFKKQFMMEYEN